MIISAPAVSIFTALRVIHQSGFLPVLPCEAQAHVANHTLSPFLFTHDIGYGQAPVAGVVAQPLSSGMIYFIRHEEAEIWVMSIALALPSAPS